VVTFTTALMTGLSGAMASVLLLVMTVVFMLFEVRHVPYKMRFALNNPQIHIAGLHRALKGVSHYLALKTLLSLWTGVIVWLGLELMGVQFALMWAVLAFLLNYVPNIGAVISAVPPMIQVLLRMHGVHFSVFPEAEHGVRQPAPVGARANHFDIAADFAFIAQQQSDIVTAMA
jgi:predicted PurR-regulated permease PerM